MIVGQSAINNIEQKVITENQEIFETLKHELRKASKEILVITAWFTDNELLNILLEKSKQGVYVGLILADNQENKRLDFSPIEKFNGLVIKVKSVGFGMMHQKFCVIDKEIAIHGSYNWTINAKNNNHESVILTRHQETIDKLISNFNRFKMEVQQKPINDSAGITDRIKSIFKPRDEVKNNHFDHQENGMQNNLYNHSFEISNSAINSFFSEYENVLDTMIAAEICRFDRDLVKKGGYEKAKETNGDYQVLPNAFDSVYSVFVNDINIVDDKKNRLLSKIDNQKNKSIHQLENILEIDSNTIEEEFNSLEQNLNLTLNDLDKQIEQNDLEVKALAQNKIDPLYEKNEKIRAEIEENQRDFIKPKFKWFDFVPSAIFCVGLLVYLLLFYSSAAYILLFSEFDAKEAQLNSIVINPPEVFDALAISKAFDKGGMAPYFIFLFVLIPVGIAISGRFINLKNLWNMVLIYSLIFIVDAFLAYTVAKSIHEVEYLSGNVDVPWIYSMVFSNPNFYLVFIMGALGLLLFKWTFEKVMKIFEERNPDMAVLQSKLLNEQKIERIADNLSEIKTTEIDIQKINSQSVDLKHELFKNKQEKEVMHSQKASRMNGKKAENQLRVSKIEKITEIYRNHIENDDFKFSLHAIKDRINTFLEGWFRFLHEEFSFVKANKITQSSNQVLENWLSTTIKSNSIDKRIKE